MRRTECFLFFLLMSIFSMPAFVYASVAGEVNKANDLYRQGRFDDSLKLYQQALDQDDSSAAVKYDLGTALYKKGDYEKALGYLEDAAQDKNNKIKPKAEYNLGNVLYKSGIQKENTNVDAAIKNMQEALGHYGETVAADPKDQDASYNQDFVKKEIERLKQIKQQQQQQQGQQSQQKDQQAKDNNTKDQKDQKNQEAKKQEAQQEKENNKPSSSQQNKNAQAQAQENQKELDRKGAEDLLQDYQENEEPKKLLNYMPKKIDDRPVLKDW